MDTKTKHLLTGSSFLNSSIGVPRQRGFGVGVCRENLVTKGIESLPGCYNPDSDNYGNYIHKPSGSILCWIPAFKYRVNDKFVNSVEVWDANDPQCPSNAVLHRAFVNGGKQKSGFFCDKYICSPDANNTMGISVKYGSALSLSSNYSYGNCTNQLANCKGQFLDAIIANRARAVGFQCMSAFQIGALRLLMLAHGQASTDQKFNAWYDSTGQHNLPRGNTNYLKDYDDPSATWTADPQNTNKGLPGSCNILGKSTHNGQNSGVADLRGIMFQVITGCIVSNGVYYFVKPEVDITSLDENTMYVTSNHNSRVFPFTDMHGWDQNKPMFNNDSTGIHWDCCGFLNTVSEAWNSRVPGMFEEDQQNITPAENCLPSYGSDWSSGVYQHYGMFATFLYRSYTFGGDTDGFRACCYV